MVVVYLTSLRLPGLPGGGVADAGAGASADGMGNLDGDGLEWRVKVDLAPWKINVGTKRNCVACAIFHRYVAFHIQRRIA